MTERMPVFTEAYTSAWDAISRSPSAINADTAIWLAAFIRSRLAAQESDAAIIAGQALKAYAQRGGVIRS